MTDFENELMKMFENNNALCDIRCFQNKLIGRLTRDTIAKITFESTNNIYIEYSFVSIDVINTHMGRIDSARIPFSRGLGVTNYQTPYFTYDDGSCVWHNLTPEKQHYENMNREAEKYLEMFCEPVHEMTVSM